MEGDRQKEVQYRVARFKCIGGFLSRYRSSLLYPSSAKIAVIRCNVGIAHLTRISNESGSPDAIFWGSLISREGRNWAVKYVEGITFGVAFQVEGKQQQRLNSCQCDQAEWDWSSFVSYQGNTKLFWLLLLQDTTKPATGEFFIP